MLDRSAPEQSFLTESTKATSPNSDTSHTFKGQIDLITHELKTPLKCNLALLKMLSSVVLPEEAEKIVQMVTLQNNLLYTLLHDYQHTRLDKAGLLKSTVSEFDPDEVFSGVARLVEMQAKLSGAQVILRFLRPSTFA